MTIAGFLTADALYGILHYDDLPSRVMRQRAEKWLLPLLTALPLYGINTPQRVAHFLGQVVHESGRLAYVRELWGPTEAQARYEGRRDLGNTEQGDGFRFRGRGLIQITGRANYRECGAAIGLPLLLRPESLEQPEVACKASAWWWSANGLNELADKGNIDHVSDRVNRGRVTAAVGDSNGYAERKLLTERALNTFSVLA